MTFSNELRGILWMILCGLCFVGVMAIMRGLGNSLPPVENAFLRYVLGLVFIIPLLKHMSIKTLCLRDWMLFGARGAVHILGIIFWFYAIANLPIADVSALGYLTPVWITIFAVIFLGERIAFLRISAIVVAFIGMLIILRPGLRVLSDADFAMILATIGFSGSYILTKNLTKRHSSAAIVAFLSLGVPIGLAPFALYVWVTPEPWQLIALLCVAGFATAGHLSMTQAFRYAPMSITQPVTFLQLVWAMLFGTFVFLDPFDIWIFFGGFIIVCAVSFISWREARAKNAKGVKNEKKGTIHEF